MSPEKKTDPTQKPIDEDDDLAKIRYWLSRPMEERIGEVERLRREFYGEDYVERYRRPRSQWPCRKESMYLRLVDWERLLPAPPEA